MVLVPGMDGTGDLFYRQVPQLARAYRVATYALRDATPSMALLVDDLRQIVDAVSPGRRAIVIGESFGGTLSLSFALAHPERVHALMILNSFPYFAPRFRLWLAIAGLRLLPWGAMTLVRRATAARLHSPHTHRAEIRRFLELTTRTTFEGYQHRFQALTRYDVRDRLGEIVCPTLFLASEHDHLVPSVAQARLMAARVPRATMQVLTGHGHICLIAPGVDLAAILAGWLGALA
ncbi:MAG TPA: alpha/beta fold hydrolase [Vicinamibacterales bacterium]|nr:alpha/beta fold hydrolase [Vicinamibacterales bacterium]